MENCVKMMNMSWKIPRKSLGIFWKITGKSKTLVDDSQKEIPENFRQSSENRRKPPENTIQTIGFSRKISRKSLNSHCFPLQHPVSQVDFLGQTPTSPISSAFSGQCFSFAAPNLLGRFPEPNPQKSYLMCFQFAILFLRCTQFAR